jgi:hypothetical protein
MEDTAAATATAAQDKIRLIRAVINKSDSAFILSDAFIQKFQELYDEEFTGDEICDEKSRYDTRIISLIDTIGKRESVHNMCNIEYKYIPEELKDYFEIKNNEYGEYINVNFNSYLKDVFKELLDEKITMEEARKKYDRCEYIRNNYLWAYYYDESIFVN